MKRKNVFVAYVLTAMMVFAALPATAVADGHYLGNVPMDYAPVGAAPFSATTEAALSIEPMSVRTVNLATVIAGANGPGWSFAGTTLTIYDGADVTVTTGGVNIEGRDISTVWHATATTTATLTLSNAVITSSVAPLRLNSRANLTLKLEGENHLTNNTSAPGINVPSDTTITISGTGSLTATGSGSIDAGNVGSGAGIGIRGAGSAGNAAVGTINIIGNANVTAIGGPNSAGIGGGFDSGTGGGGGAGGGTITIGGNANVTAIGGYPGGAGIGGGGGAVVGGPGARFNGGSGGTIIIRENANVTAVAYRTGAGIGGGGGGGISAVTPGASGTIRFEDNATVRVHHGTHNGGAVGAGTNESGHMGAITAPIYWGANATVTQLPPAVQCDICGHRPCRCYLLPGPYCPYCDGAGCPKCDPSAYTIPVISAFNAPNGTRGVSYRFQFAATGNPAPVWSHTALPPGLSLSEGGLLFGIPTEPGSFTFTVTATNSEGYDYREITIAISVSHLITDTVLGLSTTCAIPGQTATVQLRMRNNPGFSAMIMRLSFSDYLTLTDYAIGRYGIPADALEDFTPPTPGGEDSFMGWKTRNDNIYLNDLFLTLTFSVSQDAELGAFLPVEIFFENYTGGAEAPTNADGEEVEIYIANGGVNMRPFMFGDANRSGSVTSADGTFLARYLVRHPGFEIDHHAMDLNADGYVNLDDLVLLARWLVGHGAPPVIQNS